MENTEKSQDMLTREEVQQLVAEAVKSQAEGALSQREQALAEKEQALFKQQQLDKAMRMLRKYGLPETLAMTLSALDEENMEAAIEEWDAVFRAAVQLAVEERLRGSAPATGVMQDVNTLPDTDYYAAVYPHLI